MLTDPRCTPQSHLLKYTPPQPPQSHNGIDLLIRGSYKIHILYIITCVIRDTCRVHIIIRYNPATVYMAYIYQEREEEYICILNPSKLRPL